MRTSTALVCIAMSLGLYTDASATILHVPSEYPTIQAGIDAAVNGDTVLVAAGVYTGDGNRDLDLWGKAIVVVSESGPEVTIIDCGGSYYDPHRAFVFHSGEGPNSVVYGFTIRNGYASNVHQENCGGGIVCISSSSPTIAGNIFTQNRAHWGGGLYCLSSSPIVVENKIVENTANSGGGIYCRWYSTPLIAYNTIEANTASGGGGGVGCLQSSPAIVGNDISHNGANYYGGGIECWDHCSPDIIDNTITWNAAGSYGSAIYCYYYSSPTIRGNRLRHSGGIDCFDYSSPLIAENIIERSGGHAILAVGASPTIENNILRDNAGAGVSCWESSSTIRGNRVLRNSGVGIYCRDAAPHIEKNIIEENEDSGIYCRGSHSTIRGNTILRNSAESGGGIYCRSSSPAIDGNTLTGNVADIGGGVFCGMESSPTVLNSIFWADSAGLDDEIHVDASSTLDLTYSDIDGGWPGEGNIDADPVFVFADRDDYRLLWESPCIDSGNPDSLDPDGTRSDMGAHYFDQSDHLTLYLTPDSRTVAPGGQLGVTYTAINRWLQPEDFWVVTGVIVPEGDTLLIMGPEHVSLPPDTTMRGEIYHDVPEDAPLGEYEYGSMIGIPPSTLYDEDRFMLALATTKTWRVPEDCPTIQAGIDSAESGDTVLVADGIYTGEGNRDIDFWAKAIVVMSENGAENAIIDLQADSLDPHRAFHIHRGEGPNSVVRGFTITNGWIPGDGGAIFCQGTSPTIVGNHIVLNVAIQGGGISCRVGSPLIIDNEITLNRAVWDGGGIGCRLRSSPTIAGNAIIGNEAQEDGGGIWCWQESSPHIMNNKIAGNAAWWGGGICCEHDSNPTIEGNTITGNEADQGGGLHCYSAAHPTVLNSIVWDDSAGSDQEIYVSPNSSVAVTYSDVEGGWPGIGNLDADPLFVTGPLGDYYLSQIEAGQPEQSPCVDAGDPESPVPEGTTRTDEVQDVWPADMGYHYPLPAGFDRLGERSALEGEQP